MRITVKGTYIVSGSRLFLIIETVNVEFYLKDHWESTGVKTETVTQEMRSDFFLTGIIIWQLSGNTLSLAIDDGDAMILQPQ